MKGSILMLTLAFAAVLVYTLGGKSFLSIAIVTAIAAVVIALWELKGAVQDLHISLLSLLEKDLTKK